MKNYILNLIINIILIIFLCLEVVHSAERPVTFSDARVMGMGNTFTAIADDKNMLFFNPAGFATYGLIKTSILSAIMNPTLWKPRYTNIGDLTLVSLTFGLGGLTPASSDPLLKLDDMNFYEKFNNGTLTRTEAEEANKYILKLYSRAFHPTINAEVLSYARHYFGFGLFSTSDVVIQLDPTQGVLNLPNIQVKAYSDLVFPIGIGIPIPGYKRWSAGFTFKYFHRAKLVLNDVNDFVEFYQWASGDYINEDLGDYIDKHSIADIALNGVEYTGTPIKQFKIGTGTGFDLGVMYRPKFAWKFGLLLSDVYTKIKWWDKSEPSRIPINARMGAAYMPAWSLWGFLEDPILAVDLEDIFHQQGKNFFLKWHFGSEVKLLFRIISLRVGINDGYPSYGAGIDFNFYFLSKIPVLKWLRPDRIYFPKFNPNDREFVEKNPLCCFSSAILAPLLYAHIKIDVSYIGYEQGTKPGQIPDYQFLTRFSVSYSY